MTVYVAGYKGTDTDDILGVFKNLEDAQKAIREDYEGVEFNYVADEVEIEDSHIYLCKRGRWYDEWYIVETEIK